MATKFKVGDRVIVKLVNGGNNSRFLEDDYEGTITKVNEISAHYPGQRWIYIDGHGGIIESNLQLAKIKSWKDEMK